MEHLILRLIGSGLAVLTIEHAEPPCGAVERGEALVEHLLKFGSSGIGEATVISTRNLWRNWQRTGLPQSLAEAHIAALPAILDCHRPTRRGMADALGVDDEYALAATRPDPARLATYIVARAQATGDLDRYGLSQQITFFLVERLFSSLMPHRPLLRPLQPAIAKYYEHMRRSAGTAPLSGEAAAAIAASWQSMSSYAHTR